MKHAHLLFFALSICLLPACGQGQSNTVAIDRPASTNTDVQPVSAYIATHKLEQYAVATFAGGCFWCTEAAFEQIKGIKDVVSGYSGGAEQYPSYQEVSDRKTGHAEGVQIFYDPAEISFQTLLEIFFVAHDPTQYHQQGPDVGPQYRSAIFYHDETQRAQSQAYMEKLAKSGKFDKPIVTELNAYEEFWVAEGYHQNYCKNNPSNPYVLRISLPKVRKVSEVFKPLVRENQK